MGILYAVNIHRAGATLILKELEVTNIQAKHLARLFEVGC